MAETDIDPWLLLLALLSVAQPMQAWGHSTIVSPNGEVLATTEHQPSIVYAELDLDEVRERRRNMPLTQQKRTDLYELIDKTA